MSAKPYDNCKMIMVNYADLWLVHSHVARLLDGARLELRELKTRSTLFGACTSCSLLRSDLEAAAVEIKDLKHKLDYPSRYTVLSPPCEACVSLKGKLFHASKENTQLRQEVAYLTARLEKTVLSEKMIEKDLSRVEESATKSTYRLGVGFERCDDKGEKSASKFIPSSSYHKEKATIKSTKAHYPSNSKSSFNPKREARKETLKPREQAFVCMFCGRSYSHVPPHSYSRALPHTSSYALPQFAHGPNHRSYGFYPRENRLEPRRFDYGPCTHRGDRFPHRPGFPARGSFPHFELRHLNGPRFPRHGSCPTRPSGEVQRTVKISSGRMVKC
jgi:hypothetical protein